MVSLRIPQTCVRIGVYNSKLEDAVKQYHEALEKGFSILGNTVQYVTFNSSSMQSPYLLIVSQQKDRILSPIGHNVTLTVTSYSKAVNRSIADSFEKETRIDLGMQVPEEFRKLYRNMDAILPIFEKNPKLAMLALTRKH